MSDVAGNLGVLADMDRSWNERSEEFVEAHTEDVMVYAPGSHRPRMGRQRLWADSADVWAAFSDLTLGAEPAAAFGDGDRACTVRTLTGTHTGELKLYGRVIPPTGKRVEIEVCTVARFENGRIAEERRYYDLLFLAIELGAWPPA